MASVKTSESIKLCNNTVLTAEVTLGGPEECNELHISMSSNINADCWSMLSVSGIAPSELFDISVIFAKLGARLEAKQATR